VSLILFYLFNLIVNMMDRYRIPRVAVISIIYLAVVVVITLIVNLLIPIICSQVYSLFKNSPQYLEKLINSIDKIANNTFFSSYYSQINDWLNSLPKKRPAMLREFTDGFGSKIATFAETSANIGVVI
ncbi:AI-2E family transporter, partial [Staphylococcus aureus]|uniref:AI-2E family transporter n=1 Tax=Staphylococcus aureus TaxID=1280 RepID=UPI00210CCC39